MNKTFKSFHVIAVTVSYYVYWLKCSVIPRNNWGMLGCLTRNNWKWGTCVTIVASQGFRQHPKSRPEKNCSLQTVQKCQYDAVRVLRWLFLWLRISCLIQTLLLLKIRRAELVTRAVVRCGFMSVRCVCVMCLFISNSTCGSWALRSSILGVIINVNENYTHKSSVKSGILKIRFSGNQFDLCP